MCVCILPIHKEMEGNNTNHFTTISLILKFQENHHSNKSAWIGQTNFIIDSCACSSLFINHGGPYIPFTSRFLMRFHPSTVGYSRSLPIYIKKTVLFMITIKLFMIHDAQIILDSDNNKFLIYFFHNNNNQNMRNMFTLMKRLYLWPQLGYSWCSLVLGIQQFPRSQPSVS